MGKEFWATLAVMVSLFGILATIMVTGHSSINARITSVETILGDRITGVDNRIASLETSLRAAMREDHAAIRRDIQNMNARLGRVEGRLGIPGDPELEPEDKP